MTKIPLNNGTIGIFFSQTQTNNTEAIVATILALGIVWFLEKKIPKVPLISGILITFFGGLTIYFNNPVFIY